MTTLNSKVADGRCTQHSAAPRPAPPSWPLPAQHTASLRRTAAHAAAARVRYGLQGRGVHPAERAAALRAGWGQGGRLGQQGGPFGERGSCALPWVVRRPARAWCSRPPPPCALVFQRSGRGGRAAAHAWAGRGASLSLSRPPSAQRLPPRPPPSVRPPQRPGAPPPAFLARPCARRARVCCLRRGGAAGRGVAGGLRGS